MGSPETIFEEKTGDKNRWQKLEITRRKGSNDALEMELNFTSRKPGKSSESQVKEMDTSFTTAVEDIVGSFGNLSDLLGRTQSGRNEEEKEVDKATMEKGQILPQKKHDIEAAEVGRQKGQMFQFPQSGLEQRNIIDELNRREREGKFLRKQRQEAGALRETGENLSVLLKETEEKRKGDAKELEKLRAEAKTRGMELQKASEEVQILEGQLRSGGKSEEEGKKKILVELEEKEKALNDKMENLVLHFEEGKAKMRMMEKLLEEKEKENTELRKYLETLQREHIPQSAIDDNNNAELLEKQEKLQRTILENTRKEEENWRKVHTMESTHQFTVRRLEGLRRESEKHLTSMLERKERENEALEALNAELERKLKISDRNRDRDELEKEQKLDLEIRQEEGKDKSEDQGMMRRLKEALRRREEDIRTLKSELESIRADFEGKQKEIRDYKQKEELRQEAEKKRRNECKEELKRLEEERNRLREERDFAKKELEESRITEFCLKTQMSEKQEELLKTRRFLRTTVKQLSGHQTPSEKESETAEEKLHRRRRVSRSMDALDLARPDSIPKPELCADVLDMSSVKASTGRRETEVGMEARESYSSAPLSLGQTQGSENLTSEDSQLDVGSLLVDLEEEEAREELKTQLERIENFLNNSLTVQCRVMSCKTKQLPDTQS